MVDSDILIQGAQEHNLRDVKSCFAAQSLDLLYRRQRFGQEFAGLRYALCRGTAALRRKPVGLRPAISRPNAEAGRRSICRAQPRRSSISQKSSGTNPRSTVGTITEIYDYLRVLFARVGKGHCPECGRPITAQTSRADHRAHMSIPRRHALPGPRAARSRPEGRVQAICSRTCSSRALSAPAWTAASCD